MLDTFITSTGTYCSERVELWISEVGNQITSREFNHFTTDPEDYWPMSFEFVWKRKQ